MLDRIQANLDTLSPAEARVARWVLDHPREAAVSTLATVAQACGTSQPTVIRFCRHMGLSGFRELALRLTEALSRRGSFFHRAVEAGDSVRDASAKVLESAAKTLVELRHLLRDDEIEAAAAMLSQARQIVFAGIGGSGHVAGDAQHKFFRLGIPCVAVTDPPSLLQCTAIMETDDVLVVVSNSGRAPEVLAAAETSRRRRARVIALTYPSSPLGELADVVLPCSAQDETSLFTPMNSRLAQLAVLDVLQVATALTLGSKAAERLRLTKLALHETAPRRGPGLG